MFKILKKILLHQQFHKLSVYGFGQLFNLVTPLLVVPYIVSICGEENFAAVNRTPHLFCRKAQHHAFTNAASKL